MSPLLEVDCVGKRFGARQLLSCASLRAHPGTVTVLLGRNGVGKSTLFRIAVGAVRPDTGIVRYDGEVHERPSLHVLARRGLWFVPDRDCLSPSLTVGEHIAIVRRRVGKPPPAGVLELLEADALADRRPTQLSVGELRRSEVLVAAVRHPRCLLMDEPLRDLAPLDATRVLEAVRLLAAAGTAVVLTGHQVAELLDAADRVAWCTDGTTVEFASSDEARADDRFRQHYLGLA